jgi:phage baseplate assembly protein gpV
VKVKASDPPAGATAGSGVARVVIAFGDGARAKSRQAAHAYRHSGRQTVRVSATDAAGNVTVLKKVITLKRAKH